LIGKYTRHDKYGEIAKRIIDIVGLFIRIIIFNPVFIMDFILMKLDSKGPIFFKQTRVGKDSKNYNVYEFRTVVVIRKILKR